MFAEQEETFEYWNKTIPNACQKMLVATFGLTGSETEVSNFEHINDYVRF